jgi:hypothetical protein
MERELLDDFSPIFKNMAIILICVLGIPGFLGAALQNIPAGPEIMRNNGEKNKKNEGITGCGDFTPRSFQFHPARW